MAIDEERNIVAEGGVSTSGRLGYLCVAVIGACALAGACMLHKIYYSLIFGIIGGVMLVIGLVGGRLLFSLRNRKVPDPRKFYGAKLPNGPPLDRGSDHRFHEDT
jgi:hypothetical protein